MMKAITAMLNDCSQECQCAPTRTCPAPPTFVCVAQYSQGSLTQLENQTKAQWSTVSTKNRRKALLPSFLTTLQMLKLPGNL